MEDHAGRPVVPSSPGHNTSLSRSQTKAPPGFLGRAHAHFPSVSSKVYGMEVIVVPSGETTSKRPLSSAGLPGPGPRTPSVTPTVSPTRPRTVPVAAA
ncbi:hypothetical protein ABT150_49940 [Streptomyces mirabilis]|uniref:hypothetical protein n=1 Tax=Streptomyces mirabilis TaxID=68239 RepID=UPI0033243894